MTDEIEVRGAAQPVEVAAVVAALLASTRTGLAEPNGLAEWRVRRRAAIAATSNDQGTFVAKHP
jgi:hypothetical protein